MRKSKLSFLLALSLVLSMFLAACYGGGDSSEPAKEGNGEGGETAAPQVLNVLETAEIPTMNTIMAQDAVAFNVMNQVFEGLYRLDEENQPTPGMAEGEPEVSEDGTVYTFKLRDAEWSNGTPVTANDFVYAWQQAVNPDNATPYGAYMMNGVIKGATEVSEGASLDTLGVVAKDEKTLEVTLERPVPYFMSLMTFPTFYPLNQEYYESQGEAYATNSDTMIYNGPFTLTDWNGTGLSWKYQKNDSYWDAETVQLSQINVEVVKEPGTAVNLYETGETDRAGLSGEYAAQYANHEDLKKVLEPTVFYFKYNQERNGAATPLANENIRKAISLAVDKEAMVENILANGSIAYGQLVPKEFTFHPETNEDFATNNADVALGYDLEKAKEYFATGLEELGQDAISLEILGGDTEASKNMHAYLKNQLETNLEGLTVSVSEVPFKIRLDRDTNEDYDIQVAGWGPDFQDPMTFVDLFVTDGGHNHSNYSNAEYDQLVEDAKTTLSGDVNARWEAMVQAERILLEEAAFGPLYQRAAAILQQDYVKNLIEHPFGADFSYKWASVEK